MNILRLLALTLLACCLAFPAAARGTSPAERRLVGIWQDDKDPENIIQFFPDHRVRIYLTRQEGQRSGMHWINGRWRLSHGRHLSMKLNMHGKGRASHIKHKRFTLLFRKHRLVVKSGRKVLGTQHRISRQALSKHLW